MRDFMTGGTSGRTMRLWAISAVLTFSPGIARRSCEVIDMSVARYFTVHKLVKKQPECLGYTR